MGRARTFGVACAIGLVTGGVSATAQPAAVPQLVVIGAVPDTGGQTVTITGANFGTSPFVTLDLVPLTLRGAGDTRISAAVPVSMMPPGEYLLTVSRGPSPTETGSLTLILGGGKPKGVEADKGAAGGGTARGATGTPAAPGIAVSTAGAEPAVQVGDRVISVAEVDREWRRTDPASYLGLSRQMYEMRRRIADTMAADELLAREAVARALTTEALLAEEIPKRIITTPDSAVRSLYEGLVDRVRGATLDQMRPALRAWLARITEPELAKMAYVEELMKVSTRAERFLVAPRAEVERTAQDATLGPATASVDIVAFGDFQSAEYARFARAFGRVRDTFGDRIRVVFKHLPTVGPESIAAAEAAQCANAQGKFWLVHDALVAQPGTIDAARLKQVAASVGLDREAFDACVDRGGSRAVIRQALDEAKRYGLRASPSFLVNGRLAPDPPPFLPPFDFFKRIIEEELGLQARAASRPR